MNKKRKEQDALGELEVPTDAYWGISTQRALHNFKISGRAFPERFIIALARVKKACLLVNMKNEDIDQEIGKATLQAVDEILKDGKFLDQFPIDVFQTGSGTQTNMNMNEVLANRANEILGKALGTKSPVHPNDHVNMGQSSNDVIPTAMHLSALDALSNELFPAIHTLIQALEKKIDEFEGVVKVGRTHLQDAVPIPLSTEFEVYRTQMMASFSNLQSVRDDLVTVPIGGTALGTGINAPGDFGPRVSEQLAKLVELPIKSHPMKAEGIASHSVIVKASGALRLLALACLKMANDIRWMGSGPRAGLGELILPVNEPGSSIMPGKVNPTQSEALIQVCMQVMGHDATIASAEGFGSILDLNVTKPVMIVNLLDAVQILSRGITSFTENCLLGLEPNKEQIQRHLDRSLMIVTRLSPVIGYDQASKVAKRALETGKTIRETVQHMGIKFEGDLDDILDPLKMV
ncbi:MAG: class II fumarate hydratase [Candidatus Thorarchaeota archaeon]|nr:MAG: class II fumarate hydratase [Candidatus Thorarchaeota archaeon]